MASGMKTWFALLSLVLAQWCLAIDVRLSNGKTLPDVTINSVDSQGVFLTLRDGTYTKYPWGWIHPGIRSELETIAAQGERRKAAQAEKQKIQDEAKVYRVQVVQVLPEGVLATISGTDLIIFISLDSSEMYDGQVFSRKLFGTGERYRYTSAGGVLRTVLAVADPQERATRLAETLRAARK